MSRGKCLTIATAIAFLLGAVGTVTGIIACWKVYSEGDETPWCDVCKEMFNEETCQSVCVSE